MRTFRRYLAPFLFAVFFHFLAPLGSAQVILSEFMASNTQTLTDEDGDSSDWIELLNTANTNVNLNGWALTDSASNPRKWRFPSVNLGAGQTLVVFASNKDRRTPGSPLHTDFRLSANPDFLGLSDSSGQIVSSFGPTYPAQLPDISYGIVAESSAVFLLQTNAPAVVHFPADASGELSWNLMEYATDDWTPVTNGFGFDNASPSLAEGWRPTLFANAPAIFYDMDQAGGLVVTNLGVLGARENGNAVGGLIYNQPGSRPPESPGLPSANTALRFDGREDYITTGRSSLNNLPGFTITAWIRPLVLNGARAGLWGQHDVLEFGFIDGSMLQLSSPAGGTVQTHYPFPSNQWHHVAVVGDGEFLRIYVDGALLAEGGNTVSSYGSSLFPLNVAGGGIFDPSGNFFNGLIDEFAVFTRALSADEIARLFQAARDPSATFDPQISTQIPKTSGNATVYSRFAFAAEPEDFTRFILRAQYDDGFIAFLNGVEIARANAPAEARWNSAASMSRPGPVGLLWQEFDISRYTGLLKPGTNLLAVQLLNASGDDGDLFLRVELTGIGQTLQPDSHRYFLQPTPGAINGFGQANFGPLVVNLKHSPEIPQDSEPITVTATMRQTFNPPSTLSLVYRVMFGSEVTMPMLDDGRHGDGAAGDGVYGAMIPPSAATKGQMVRWYLRATDIQGWSTRWPLYRDTRNSPQYFGTVIADPTLTNPLPVLHWFIQTPSGADSTTGTRASVFWNGVLYDNIFVNVHGQSSQSFPKKSYNFDFNRGFRFQYSPFETPVEDVNLLTTYPDKAHIRNILAYETFRDAGHAYHFVIPVRVQRNGAFFSDAHLVEDAEEEFLARVGLDPEGALYKMYNSLDSAISGVEKKTRKYEGNNDLQRLINGVRLTGNARAIFLYDNVDLPAMANYLAAMVITGNVDCCHKNYYLYRDSRGNGEWRFLPWDLDLSFGRNWTGSAHYYDDTMYTANGIFVGSNNQLLSSLHGTPDFRQMFLRRLRTLMDELMQPPGTPAAELKYERRIRELYEIIAPDAALDYAKWPSWGIRQTMPQALAILTNQYFPGRRNYLYVNQRSTIPAATPEEVKLRFGTLDFNPATGLQSQEYLTLINTNSFAVDISGWRIEGGVKHTFAPGTVIPVNGTLFVSPDVTAFRLRATSPRGGERRFVQGNYSGQLSARGETLILTDRENRIAASLTYAGVPTPWQRFLRVSEVMFAPPPSEDPTTLTEDLEYIVLKNTGTAPLDMNGIRLDSGVEFTLGSDFLLNPGEHLYVAKNPEVFRKVYGTSFSVVGPYLGQLSNGGETISLYDPVGEKVLDFTFDNDWFRTGGRSLLSVSDTADYTVFQFRQGWAPSAYPGGSAGLPLAWKSWKFQRFLGDEEKSRPDADPDGDGQSNLYEFTVGTDPLDPFSAFYLTISSFEGSPRLTISAAPGRQYTVLGSNDLIRWEEVSKLPRPTRTTIQTVLLETLEATPRLFYRVIISL